MAFARHQFELSAPQDDGQPLLAHLQAMQEKSGRVHSMITNAPPIPPSCGPLWDSFLALHGCRGSSGFGSARITFADMDCYQRVTGARLSPWDVEVIRKTDSMWLSDFAPKPKEEKK